MKRIYLPIISAFYIGLLYSIIYVEQDYPDSSINNVFDAIWFFIVTLTTVGYGDYYPVSTMGKILSIPLVISSLGLLGFLIGNISNKIRSIMEKKKFGLNGTKFTNHFVIIGWNDFGKKVVTSLPHSNFKIAIITNKKEELFTIKENYASPSTYVLFSDFNNYELLKKANLTKANAVFINLQNDTDTLVALLNLKKHFKNNNYVIALQESELKDTFKSIGVTKIVSKEEISANLVASYIFEPDVALYTEDLMTTQIRETDSDIQQFKVTQSNPFLDQNYMKTFVEIKQKYNAILLGLSRYSEGKRILIKNPEMPCHIKLNDYLLMVVEGKSVANIEIDFDIKEGVRLE